MTPCTLSRVARRIRRDALERFQPYSDYRPTNIPYIDRLPAHWRQSRLKYLARINPDKLADDTDDDFEIEYVDIGNVTLLDGITSTEHLRFADAPSRARRTVLSGDTILSTVRTYLKAVAKIERPPANLVVSTGFAVLRPRTEVVPSYLYRLAQSEPFIERVVACSTGVSYPAVNPSDLGIFEIPLPPPSEQQAIAAFLDRETAKIDELVAKKERMIGLLEEKRDALVTRVLTQGLRPNVSTARVQSRWYGSVPQHWVVRKAKYLTSRIGSGKTPRGGAEVYVPAGVMLLRSQNIHFDGLRLQDVVFIDEATDAEMSSTRVQPGDTLLNITGASIGRCCLSTREVLGANVNQHVCILRPKRDQVLPEFLNCVVGSTMVQSQILAGENGTSREGLNFQQVGNIEAAIPPLDEQREIVAYLDTTKDCVHRLTGRVNDGTAWLREYRTSLVTAAVTGRIDVRGYSECPSCR